VFPQGINCYLWQRDLAPALLGFDLHQLELSTDAL
jgi:hypothetical protein